MTQLTDDLNADGSLYGIDNNNAATTGPFHAPVGFRVNNTSGATITPKVVITMLTMSLNPVNSLPCGFFTSTAGSGTTASYSGLPISNNSSYDYYFDMQFQRDSNCADKNNAHRTFSYQIDVYSPASTFPAGPAVATFTSGVTPIVGLAVQSNDTAGFTGCADGLGNPLTPVNGVYEITVNQEFTCTFTWSTSSGNFDGVRVWQDWLGSFFEITKVNSRYPGTGTWGTGTFAPPNGTFSPDCFLNGGCGSAGKANIISQDVNVRAVAAITSAPGVACPPAYGSSSFCVSITSTTYDETASGTHYQTAVSPPIFTVKGTPTAVKLKSFEATRSGDDTLLSWRTGREVSNLGFRLYREGPNGERVPVMKELVAGDLLFTSPKVGLTSGRSYNFADHGAPAGSTYWLEDVDISGASTLNGPVYPKESLTAALQPIGAGYQTQSAGGNGNSPFLSDSTARGNSTIKSPAGFGSAKGARANSGTVAANSANLNRQFSLAGLPGMKLLVKQDGWYRVTHQDLISAGWDPGASSTNLQLYAEGQPIPMLVNDFGGGNYSLEFYGTGLDTVATDTRVYWIGSSATAGTRLASKTGSLGSASGSDFPFTVERKDRVIYVPGIQNGDAESWYGPIVGPSWFGFANQSVNVTHLNTSNSNSVNLEIAVETATADVEHSIDVFVNGNLAGTLSLFGQGHFDSNLSIPGAWLVEGSNSILLQEEGADAKFSIMDYVALTYPHLFVADSDALEVSVSGGRQVRITGFTVPGVRVFDITNPSAVTMLSSSVASDGSGGYSVTANTPSVAGALDLLAIANDRVSAPSGLANNVASSLNKKNNSADFVVIAHPSFISAAGPLAQLRQSQGLSTQVVDVSDVYDEFSFGEKDPAAIKAFLQNAKSTWKKAPKYVLLLGDGSYDPRDYFGLGTTDFVPAKLLPTFFLKTASDDWYVDFNNDGAADMAIGRLPAQTLPDATTMVSKIVGYESSAPSPDVLIAGDHNDENDFHGAVSALVNLVGNGKTAHVLCVDPDSLDPSYPNIIPCVDAATVHSGLVNGINNGQALVNWVGHGEPTSWSQQNVFDTSDVAGLTNSGHLPVFLTMDCLNGYFHDPNTESMAETLLRAPNGGAVAVWASSSLTLFDSQVPVNQSLFQQLFSAAPPRIGDAINVAKRATTDSDVKKTWIFFGDPTMSLK